MPSPLRILITGATGFVGSSLARFLAAQGHHAIPLSRSASARNGPTWNPEAGTIDLSPAGDLDAVVHLAGHSIACRWTRRARERIRQSRIAGTQLLCQALGTLNPPPHVLLSASGIGYYGDQGSTLLTEQSPPGTGFLATLARDWEEAALAAQTRGVRVVPMRFGVVVSEEGGALARMLPAFRLGLGGRLSHGNQFWSWISLEDLHRAILHALTTPSLSGPVNFVSPNPVPQRIFAQTLGRTLNRPAILPIPAFVLKLLMGEMAEATMLSSTRAVPAKLDRSGFKFLHSDLKDALARRSGFNG